MAVSGGVDSMVLCHLLLESGFNFVVAYVDHNTRGNQSYEDGQFVKQFAEQNRLAFHLHTLRNIDQSGNFHNLAHKERYAFFESLDYDLILTGHHYDDRVETIIINFLNGRSVSTIPQTNGKIVRPLLLFKKEELVEYANSHEIAYREDSSNAENYYLRNYIRNEILPRLKSNLNKDLGLKLLSLAKRTDSDYDLLKSLIQKSCPGIKTNNQVRWNLTTLLKYDSTYLYHLISEYGFSRDLCHQIFDSLNKKGRQFYCSAYQCIIGCLLYTSPSPRDATLSRMPSSA